MFKTYFIRILAVLNVIFAVYVFFDVGQRLSDNHTVNGNLEKICAAAGLIYDSDTVSDAPEFSWVFTREPADELTFVKRLLGEDTAVQTIGGGIVQYSGNSGEALFRENGTFELSLPDFEVRNGRSNSANELANRLGLLLRKTDERSDTLTYVLVYDKREVFNQTFKFEFGAEKGVKISGTYASGAAVRVTEPKSSGFATTAPRFWDTLSENGYLISNIYSADAGYIYAEYKYTAAWRFSTDVGEFIFADGKIIEG
jgi:hypothetical protein